MGAMGPLPSPAGLQSPAGSAGPGQALRGRGGARHDQIGAVLQLYDLLPHLQDREAHVLQLLHGPVEPLSGEARELQH